MLNMSRRGVLASWRLSPSLPAAVVEEASDEDLSEDELSELIAQEIGAQ